MDSTNPKISFIPKSSLVREESFFERSRPRSVMNIIAVVLFTASVGGYASLYVWNKSLLEQTAEKNKAIAGIQVELQDSAKVRAAQAFQSRTDIANEVLDGYTIVSPVTDFISKNTLKDIFYSRFSLTGDAQGMKVSLSGEAPTYTTLINQKDFFGTKAKELSDFKISNVSLTSLGTVSFDLTLSFSPEYVSYVKSRSGSEKTISDAVSTSTAAVSADFSKVLVTPATTTMQQGVGSKSPHPSAATFSAVPRSTSTEVSGVDAVVLMPRAINSSTSTSAAATTQVLTPAPAKGTSAMSSFWSHLKFW